MSVVKTMRIRILPTLPRLQVADGHALRLSALDVDIKIHLQLHRLTVTHFVCDNDARVMESVVQGVPQLQLRDELLE